MTNAVPTLQLDWSATPDWAVALAAGGATLWLLITSVLTWWAVGWALFGRWWRAVPSLVAIVVLVALGLPQRWWASAESAISETWLTQAALVCVAGLPVAVVGVLRDRAVTHADAGRLAGRRARLHRSSLSFG